MAAFAAPTVGHYTASFMRGIKQKFSIKIYMLLYRVAAFLSVSVPMYDGEVRMRPVLALCS